MIRSGGRSKRKGEAKAKLLLGFWQERKGRAE